MITKDQLYLATKYAVDNILPLEMDSSYKGLCVLHIVDNLVDAKPRRRNLGNLEMDETSAELLVLSAIERAMRSSYVSDQLGARGAYHASRKIQKELQRAYTEAANDATNPVNTPRATTRSHNSRGYSTGGGVAPVSGKHLTFSPAAEQIRDYIAPKATAPQATVHSGGSLDVQSPPGQSVGYASPGLTSGDLTSTTPAVFRTPPSSSEATQPGGTDSQTRRARPLSREVAAFRRVMEKSGWSVVV